MLTLDINGVWKLSPLSYEKIAPFTKYFQNHTHIPCTLPGDIHSALLESSVIIDPYIGTQELDIQWVGRNDWILERTFLIPEEMLADRSAVLTLTMADTIISVWVNGKQVGSCDNQFRRWRFDISDALNIGENSIKLIFTSAESHASHWLRSFLTPSPTRCIRYRPSIATLFERPSATAAGIGVHAS